MRSCTATAPSRDRRFHRNRLATGSLPGPSWSTSGETGPPSHSFGDAAPSTECAAQHSNKTPRTPGQNSSPSRFDTPEAAARLAADPTSRSSNLRNPRDFFKPLAVGAPTPMADVPFKPSRMIHFFDASNEKMVAKLPDTAAKADIVLGNLEDAVPVDRKEAAREGLIKVGKEVDLGDTPLWTRVNALDSPWVLDDLTELVTQIGDKLEVVMVPKVEGPWDIHYVDRLLAQLEA